MASLHRASLEAELVYRAPVDELKEGVAECLVFAFDYREKEIELDDGWPESLCTMQSVGCLGLGRWL